MTSTPLEVTELQRHFEKIGEKNLRSEDFDFHPFGSNRAAEAL